MTIVMEITGNETSDQLVKLLVYLRHLARSTVMMKDAVRQLRALYVARAGQGHDLDEKIAEIDEHSLGLKFDEIKIGRYLVPLCSAIDEKVPREALFDALNVNRADRDSEDIRKYGHKASTVICVLDLENSATKSDDIEVKPLKWCHTMAFMHELQTNREFDEIVHDVGNEFFKGAFGEFRDRPLTERLVGRASAP